MCLSFHVFILFFLFWKNQSSLTLYPCCLCTYVLVCLVSACLRACVPVYLRAYVLVFLCAYVLVCLCICVLTCLLVGLSVYLRVLVSVYRLSHGWPNLYGTWHAAHGTWAHLNGFPRVRLCATVSQSQSQSQRHSYIMTDDQSANLSWCQVPAWDQRPIFLLLSLIIFRQLGFVDVASSLTRGRVCSFLWCRASLAQSFSSQNPAELKTNFLLSQFWDSPNLEGQVSVFMPSRNRVVHL
jgi:hypothetical protein